MRWTIVAAAVAGLFLAVAPGKTESAAKTVAREQALYETLTFGPPLRSAELYAALDRVATSTTEQSFAARYFKGRQEWPAACTGLFTGLGGYEVKLTLNGKTTEGDGRGYFVMLAREAGLAISASWRRKTITSASAGTIAAPRDPLAARHR